MTRVTFVQWPDGLEPRGPAFEQIRRQLDAANTDILVTNEMPFGAWAPTEVSYNATTASEWVEIHERGLDALRQLPVSSIVSSRPVLAGDRLANEAFAIENGQYRPLHHKQLFPAESGWQEAAWFRPATQGFSVHNIGGLDIGVLLCTELMFNENARHLGRMGADLIAVPRATGQGVEVWRIACAMAAIVSGAYVVSSNRSEQADNRQPLFGGRGFAFAPGGELLGATSDTEPLATIIIDRDRTKAAKDEYPCYVPELSP